MFFPLNHSINMIWKAGRDFLIFMSVQKQIKVLHFSQRGGACTIPALRIGQEGPGSPRLAWALWPVSGQSGLHKKALCQRTTTTNLTDLWFKESVTPPLCPPPPQPLSTPLPLGWSPSFDLPPLLPSPSPANVPLLYNLEKRDKHRAIIRLTWKIWWAWDLKPI